MTDHKCGECEKRKEEELELEAEYNEDIDYSSPPPIVRGAPAQKRPMSMIKKSRAAELLGDEERDVGRYPAGIERGEEIAQELPPDLDVSLLGRSPASTGDAVDKEIEDLLAKRRLRMGKGAAKPSEPIEIRRDEEPKFEWPFADPMDKEMRDRGRKKLF